MIKLSLKAPKGYNLGQYRNRDSLVRVSGIERGRYTRMWMEKEYMSWSDSKFDAAQIVWKWHADSAIEGNSDVMVRLIHQTSLV